MNDDLLRKAKAGSAAALNELLSYSQRYAFAVIKGFLGRRFQAKLDIDDIVQNTLIEVAMSLSDRCKADNYHAYLRWLSCVARNATYKEIERLTSKKRVGGLDAKPVRSLECLAKMRCVFLPGESSHEPNTENNFFLQEAADHLLDIACQDGPKTRDAMRMIMDGAKFQTIATRLGISRQTIYRMTSRVRERAFSSTQV